jgi:hypothetical protein
MTPLPETIDEVIARMDAIITESLETGSRLGYFAALYRKVTTEVKENIEKGNFVNPELLGRLAVTFAGRYFTAYDLYKQNDKPTAPWEVTFSASKRRYPIILQHLLLGMNAHINLDLAIASADTSPGIGILGLKQDFMQINSILASQIPVVLKAINKCSPFIGLISFFYKNTEEKVTHFSLDLARAYSWMLAEDLALHDLRYKEIRVEKTAGEVRKLAEKLLHTKGLVKLLIFAVALAETNNVRKNILVLSGI